MFILNLKQTYFLSGNDRSLADFEIKLGIFTHSKCISKEICANVLTEIIFSSPVIKWCYLSAVNV